MEKKHLTPHELIQTASQFAYCAETLLGEEARLSPNSESIVDTLLPSSALIYQAF